ncbi:MAG: RluA family pseudouridine synthase [bacterium]|nr:RluA family pseudouridine synthase [bacterium]
MQFIITAEYAKTRLDVFLKEHFPDLSRARLQKLIKDGQVTINEEKVSVHHFLKEGDEVEATVAPSVELLVTPNPEVRIVAHNAPSSSLSLRAEGQPPLNLRGGVTEVLHEEADFIVLNKPSGLVVHQGEGHKTPDTLANGLLARYPEIGKVGDDPIRPGIMHRLDGDVSGVIVIARTQDMFDHLKKQFKIHTIEKEYLALVHGKVAAGHGIIDFAIARKGAKMIARPKGGEGKNAVTEYEVVKATAQQSNSTAQNTTLLKILTHTGRTHQIRVHLFAIDHPIVGDRLYESKISKSSEIGKSSRLMLHARRLAFNDLKGERREFIVEAPEEFLSKSGKSSA